MRVRVRVRVRVRIRVRNAHQRVEFEVLKNGQNGSKTRGMLARVSKMSLILNVLTRAYSTIKKEAVKKESSYKLKKIMTNHKFFLKVPIFGIAKFSLAPKARGPRTLFFIFLHFYFTYTFGIPLFTINPPFMEFHYSIHGITEFQ